MIAVRNIQSQTCLKTKQGCWYLLLLLIGIAILSACSNNSSTNQSVFTPVRPDPPTLERSLTLQPGSNSVVESLATILNYTHPTARFSINYPENWDFFERPDGVVFIEPDARVGYSVFFSDVGEMYSENQLNQYLVNFVAQNFANKDADFSVISPEQVTNGTAIAQFTGLDPNLGQAINEIRVSQKDTFVFTVLMSATQDRWDIEYEKLQKFVGTLVFLDTTLSPVDNQSTTDIDEPVWVLIGPTSNEFGFLAPSDWEIVQQDESTVVVVMPETNIHFEATVSPWPGPQKGVEAAEEAARDYLLGLSERYSDVQNLPSVEFPISQVTGATIDFLYTNEDDVEMAGSVITAVKDGQVYRIVFTSPAELYDGALRWFNPMLQNFAILSPDDFIVDE